MDARDVVALGAAGTSTPPEMHATTHRLLLVDDDVEVRELVAESLRGAGYDVEEAGDGLDALAAIARTCPSLLITDCNMPNMSGQQLLAQLALDERLSGIPAIMVSAIAQPTLPTNASAFLAKPFTMAMLHAVIRDCLGTT